MKAAIIIREPCFGFMTCALIGFSYIKFVVEANKEEIITNFNNRKITLGQFKQLISGAGDSMQRNQEPTICLPV